MKKLAVFVEGQTEREFVRELLIQVVGYRNIHVDINQGYGGGAAGERVFIEIQASGPDPSKQYYAIIFDSSNDDRVLSDIRERAATLEASGFSEIVAVRDVYPQPSTVISTIRADFTTFAPASTIPITLVLCIREAEAWFIAEHTHFSQIRDHLTPSVVRAALGYDPASHDAQTIDHPAEDLGKAYQAGGRGYNKSLEHVERTVRVLDYSAVYWDLPGRIPDLGTLVGCVNRFLS